MIQDLHYLSGLLDELEKKWPENRTVNIVCHGHSVPSGYFATPLVDPFHAYPHLLHQILKERFPFAVINVIVTAIGGETSPAGAERFERDVLTHRPDLVTIDYGLNDRMVDFEQVQNAWDRMVTLALAQNCKVVLMTPTWDNSYYRQDDAWQRLLRMRDFITELAERRNVGLADSFGCYERRVHSQDDLPALLSHVNHPSAEGHAMVAAEIAKYFPAR